MVKVRNRMRRNVHKRGTKSHHYSFLIRFHFFLFKRVDSVSLARLRRVCSFVFLYSIQMIHKCKWFFFYSFYVRVFSSLFQFFFLLFLRFRSVFQFVRMSTAARCVRAERIYVFCCRWCLSIESFFVISTNANRFPRSRCLCECRSASMCLPKCWSCISFFPHETVSTLRRLNLMWYRCNVLFFISPEFESQTSERKAFSFIPFSFSFFD